MRLLDDLVAIIDPLAQIGARVGRYAEVDQRAFADVTYGWCCDHAAVVPDGSVRVPDEVAMTRRG